MISLPEAQELHELIGGSLEATESGDALRDPATYVAGLQRARELAALLVADAIEQQRTRQLWNQDAKP